jgi:hypothetical protein
MEGEKITEAEFLELCKKHLQIVVDCWSKEKDGITVELRFKSADGKTTTISECEGYW